MRIRWRGLELPTRVVNDPNVSTPTYGKFSIEPFERGFGTTVGNSLRRILLSSLQGASVTSIKITGAGHEFMAIPGVMEDVVDIVLNIKSLIIKSHTEGVQKIYLRSNVKGPITADVIECDPSVEVLNGDLVIATLTDSVPFEMELEICTGRGYVPAEELVDPDGDQELGRIHVDAYFSPVTRVRYATEDTRVGQKTNYDRLVMEIWTNGTITPEMAMVEAAKILRKHLNPFVQYFELGEQIVESGAGEAVQEVDTELNRKLLMTTQEMELSVRANNCLESAEVDSVAQLVNFTEAELLKIRSFGKTSLREVKKKLSEMGLSLGMNVPMPDPSMVAEEEVALELGDESEVEAEE
jgi:DNA-directed RNA polymerase subunit alpha